MKVDFLYMNGRVKRMDLRFADILMKLKKGIIVDSEFNIIDDEYTLEDARLEYQQKFGKKAFHGWSLEQIQAKINGEI